MRKKSGLVAMHPSSAKNKSAQTVTDKHKHGEKELIIAW